MSRRARAAAALAVTAGLATGGVAAAQTFFGPGAGEVVEQRTVRAAVTGEVTITFRGPAGRRGTIVVEPTRASALDWFRTRTDDGSHLEAFLDFEHGGDPQVRAVVDRGTAPDVLRCSDAVPAHGELEVTGGRRLTVRVLPRSAAGRTDLQTRCGGPLVRDLGALPQATLDLAALRAGRRTLDLRADHPFSGGGYTGTVRSTVQVRLGEVRRTGEDDAGDGYEVIGGDDLVRTRTRRWLTARYRVAAVRGRVGIALEGTGPPAVCRALDSCGARGQATVRPRARSGALFLFATAPARTAPAALRAALGLGPGPAARTIRAGGGGGFGGRSPVAVTVRHGDFSRCDSQGRAGPGSLSIDVRDGRLVAAYGPDGLENRCAGPRLQGPLASGSVPLRALRKRTVTIGLTTGRTRVDDGWTATTDPDLEIVLRRTSVRTRLVDEAR